ncbi:MAG: hypothetical protein K5666_05225 [Bacilli bacterium]|nr:hypothetical protein [Bacilli bacterium]
MALASVAALTGCEKKGDNNTDTTTTTTEAASKQLSCLLTADGTTIRVSASYEGGKITKATISGSKKFASEKEAKKEYEEGQKEQKEMLNYKGLNVSVSQSGTLASYSYSFTIDKMDDKATALYNELFEEIKDKSYDEAKETLTKATYTCK